MGASSPAFRPAVHGWLNLDKPLGLTSTQALGKARRLLGGKKAGHGGTLDPLATGVLPLAFGEATKLIPYVMDGDKEYEFTVRWGEARATGDAEGEVTATSAKRPTAAEIQAALPAFCGMIEQIPPAYSAIKVDGARAYDLARAGEAVDLAPRRVMIYHIELMDILDADRAVFRVLSGKGMYVRSLARDLAETLGSCGHVAALRRTKVGPFTLENACSMPELERLASENAASSALLPMKAALDGIPTLNLSPQEAQTLISGQSPLIRPQHSAFINEPVLFAEHQGVPVALVEPKAGVFRVLRGFCF